MLCPDCGRENADGRKFCRACAKPLASEVLSEAISAKPAPSTVPVVMSPLPTARVPTSAASAPVVNRMAIASFALSVLTFIVPVGIAAVVMGHVSRRQIANSQGRQTGTGWAFAGLIIGYLQLAVVALLMAAAVGFWRDLNRHLDHDPYVRAALVERIMNGDPDHPSAAVMAKNGKNLVDALRLIPARQEAYQARNSGTYACQLIYLENLGTDDELIVLVRNSHYGVQLRCGKLNDEKTAVVQYSVIAMPNPAANLPDAPSYCADETKTIRRYANTNTDGLSAILMYQRQSCPEDGEIVE